MESKIAFVWIDILSLSARVVFWVVGWGHVQWCMCLLYVCENQGPKVLMEFWTWGSAFSFSPGVFFFGFFSVHHNQPEAAVPQQFSLLLLRVSFLRLLSKNCMRGVTLFSKAWGRAFTDATCVIVYIDIPGSASNPLNLIVLVHLAYLTGEVKNSEIDARMQLGIRTLNSTPICVHEAPPAILTPLEFDFSQPSW